MTQAARAVDALPAPTGIAAASAPAIRFDQQRVTAGAHHWHVDRYTAANRDEPTCLMLHGTGASADSWQPLAMRLGERLNIIAPDLPAHARTRSPETAPLDIDAQASELDALIDELGIEPQLLIGHSAGALIAAAWRLKRSQEQPARAVPRLVCLNGAMLPLEGPAGWLFQPLARLSNGIGLLPRLFALRAAREPQAVERLLGSTGSTIDAAMVARYKILMSDPVHVAGVLRMMASWDLNGFAARIPTLGPAVHLFAAERDTTIPARQARRLAAAIPGATLDVLPGLGHLAHEEAPDRVAQALRARLANHGVLP